ncbi:MAG: T9SS type A sorting domain-containing protein [Bacteroidales bacterium]|jgi:hypothetical protein|nr:T9SS type A sorting domain-containing protein [Bacteroidales bacterium]
MKNKTVLFVLLSFAFVLRAQEYSYVPFVQEGARWSYCTRPFDYTFVPNRYYFVYEINGDTTINFQNYKIMKNGCNNAYIAALREQDKKVYLINYGEEKERLLYDFSLSVGDTFCHPYPDTFRLGNLWVVYGLYEVISIDTIQVGECLRKRFNTHGALMETFIEGIGTPYSLSFFLKKYRHGLPLGVVYELNYKKENGEIVYRNADEEFFTENDCGTVRIENNLEKSENILYQNSPNPFNKKTTIQYKLSEKTINAKICIYDLNGKELRCFNLNTAKGTSSVEVNASDLPAGIYLYSLIVDNKVVATKRMILTE